MVFPLPKIPDVDIQSITTWHRNSNAATEEQKKQVAARLSVINKRIDLLDEKLSQICSSPASQEPARVFSFWKTKKDLLELHKEKEWIEHLICTNPFATEEEETNYVPHLYEYNRVFNVTLTTL